MMSSLAQLLVVAGEKLPVKKDADQAPSPYRLRCNTCDALNRDARLPCEGHAPVSVL
jgi:hypothetical protein